ncbi:hypothetical protein IW140_005993 [Coemansia sp. RSA 1813]|nr:hypothetical protein EV178_005997 [Coemansia sp. RSA 1646]KAJ1767260.1 hypothetical protein LPJ74_005469 [Coemansia sp. RSA 1843]KAJ2086030.1 hypothetical protein IW138_005956 [Coemansia sp. RSA 986]KAJ2210818.1 hypothetical protein EV179_005971 [Coemansia sp. RSA 487]KAJ2563754.1 hypothetical protein IW140_005993 [Coemansia sp. RSA 1813]
MSAIFDEEAATQYGQQSGSIHPLPAAPNADVVFSWDDLVYKVKTKVDKKDEWRAILHGITGEARAGEAIAIIGSSGAGKTTLLNALSGRIVGGKLSGRILYRGAPRHPGNFKRVTAYVQQDDLMHPLLTVQETLTYASKLRMLNNQYSASQKNDRVNEVIRQLRLEGARNTPIGDAATRGVSGGERKRVSIGMELLTDPRLLFLDEPTSGLDSNSSELVVELVKKISIEQGIATLMTIHQPSARIFNIFDKVILLSQGRVVYFGPTASAIQYFASIGYQCPVHENPADYFVDIMTLDYRSEEALEKSKEQVKLLANKFQEHSGNNQLTSSASSEKQEPSSAKESSKSGGASSPRSSGEEKLPRNSWLYEYSTLARRDWHNALRNIPFLSGQITQSLFMALLIGFMFFYLKHDAHSVQNRLGVLFIIAVNATFPIVMPMLTLYYKERDIMVRERSSATFRITSFFISKFTTYLPIAFVCNTVFFIGVYFISRLTIDAGKFFIGLAVFYCVTSVSISYLMVIGSAVKSMEVGFVIAPALLTIQLLFGGLFANPHTITPVLRWIRWVNPVQYAFAALVQNEFRGLVFDCQAGEQCYSDGQAVIDSYAVGRFTVWQNVLMLLMLAAVDMVVGYIALRWKAKPKYIWL